LKLLQILLRVRRRLALGTMPSPLGCA